MLVFFIVLSTGIYAVKGQLAKQSIGWKDETAETKIA